MRPSLHLGASRPLKGGGKASPFRIPAHHLVTHGVVLGMTGSGKTGLVTVMVEEALRASIPVLVIDVKGDLPNLLFNFPTFDPSALLPWIDASHGDVPVDELAKRAAEQRRAGLEAFGLGERELVDYAARSRVRVITPGADAGELLHVLSSLERRSSRWEDDIDGARAALSAAVSLLLRLLGRDPDPARSKEHVLLSVVAEARLKAGKSADIGELLADIVDPPLESIGALSVDQFLSKRARRDRAASLNSRLASPSFASWRQGVSLDVAEWMRPVEGRTPATVVSVAHLDDEERALVLGVLLEEVLSWVRGLPGSQALKALVVFDETYGFLPPHPASPPTKRPLVALMNRSVRSPRSGRSTRRSDGAKRSRNKRARMASASSSLPRTQWIWTTARSPTPASGASDDCRPTPTERASSTASRTRPAKAKAPKSSATSSSSSAPGGLSSATPTPKAAASSSSRAGPSRTCADR